MFLETELRGIEPSIRLRSDAIHTKKCVRRSSLVEIKFSTEEILKDTLKLHTAERMFQLIVDEIIDINTHIIRAKVLPAPDDIQGTFTVLGDTGILPKEFTFKMAPMVGLRNAIVHRYEHVSLKLFVSLLKNNFNDFKRYSIMIAERFL